MKTRTTLGKCLLMLLLTVSFDNVFSQGLKNITIAGSVTDSSGRKLQGASIIGETQPSLGFRARLGTFQDSPREINQPTP